MLKWDQINLFMAFFKGDCYSLRISLYSVWFKVEMWWNLFGWDEEGPCHILSSVLLVFWVQNHWVMLLDCCGAESLREVRKQLASRLWIIQAISSPRAGLVPARMFRGEGSLRKPEAFIYFYFGGFDSSSFLSAKRRHTSSWTEQLLVFFFCLTGVSGASWFRWRCGCWTGGIVGSGQARVASQTSSNTSRKLKFGIFPFSIVWIPDPLRWR